MSCRCAFYSRQTEVNASQSNCVPACESVCECVFRWAGRGWVAEKQLDGSVVELEVGGVVVIGGR